MKTLMRTNGIPSLFDDFLMRDLLDWSDNWKSHGATLPAVNIAETNDDFKIEVAAPGMKRDDFKVELDNGTLTISSQREERHDEKDNNGNYTKREFSYQAFQRRFALPEGKVDGENISARYEDGILHILVPKKEEAKVKPAKLIAVS